MLVDSLLEVIEIPAAIDIDKLCMLPLNSVEMFLKAPSNVCANLDTFYNKNGTIKYIFRNVEFLNRRGIPEQYGMFFAMGGALIMEGLLSACYHICPTVESFQFDTTFMYIMAVLVFLKVTYN